MTDPLGTGSSTPDQRERAETAASVEGEPEAGEQDAPPAPESEGVEHSVQDRYVARRLAESAVRSETERRTAEEIEGLAGEAVEDSPLGFYLALGVIVAALLLAVIWLNGTRRELPPGIIPRPAPAAPAARTGPAPNRAPPTPPAAPAPSLSPSAGPGTSPPAEGAPGAATSPPLAPPSLAPGGPVPEPDMRAPGAAAPGQSPTEAPPAGPGSVRPVPPPGSPGAPVFPGTAPGQPNAARPPG